MVTCSFPFNRRRWGADRRAATILHAGQLEEFPLNELTVQVTEEDIVRALEHTNSNVNPMNEKGNRGFTIKPFHSQADLDQMDESDDEEEDEDEDEDEDEQEEEDSVDLSSSEVGSRAGSYKLGESTESEVEGQTGNPEGRERPGSLEEEQDTTGETEDEKEGDLDEGEEKATSKDRKKDIPPRVVRPRARPAKRYLEYVRERASVKSIFRPSSEYLRGFNKFLTRPKPPPRTFDGVGESIDSYI